MHFMHFTLKQVLSNMLPQKIKPKPSCVRAASLWLLVFFQLDRASQTPDLINVMAAIANGVNIASALEGCATHKVQLFLFLQQVSNQKHLA